MIESLRNRQRTLPRVGKIHLGIRDENDRGVEFPKAVDHFVVEASETTPPEAVEAFRAVYGDKPRALKIEFPTDREDVIFDVWLKAYRRQGLPFCRGDEKVAIRTMEDGSRMEIPCPGEECELYRSSKCRRVGILRFLLPDVRGFGVWQLDTGSWNSFKGVLDALDLMRLAFGRISGIPMTLRLVPKQVEIAGRDGKRFVKTIYHLTLVDYQTKLADMRALARKRPALDMPVPPPSEEEAPEDLFPRSQLEGKVPLEPVEAGRVRRVRAAGGPESGEPEPAEPTDATIEVNGKLVDVQTGEVLGEVPSDGEASAKREKRPPASEEQARMERLHGLAIYAGFPEGEVHAKLHEVAAAVYGVASLSELTAEQADDLAGRLRAVPVFREWMVALGLALAEPWEMAGYEQSELANLREMAVERLREMAREAGIDQEAFEVTLAARKCGTAAEGYSGLTPGLYRNMARRLEARLAQGATEPAVEGQGEGAEATSLVEGETQVAGADDAEALRAKAVGLAEALGKSERFVQWLKDQPPDAAKMAVYVEGLSKEAERGAA